MASKSCVVIINAPTEEELQEGLAVDEGDSGNEGDDDEGNIPGKRKRGGRPKQQKLPMVARGLPRVSL